MEIIEILDEETYDVNNDIFSLCNCCIFGQIQHLCIFKDSQCKFKQNDTNCSGRKKKSYKYRWIIGCTNYGKKCKSMFYYYSKTKKCGMQVKKEEALCNGFFSRNYAALAKVTKFYAKILFYDALGQILEAVEVNRLKDWIRKELIRSNAKPIGLYFDGAFRDRSWIGETYNNHPSVYNDLGIIMGLESIIESKSNLIVEEKIEFKQKN
ncbi:hypothetical protein RhiirC2_710541 [Rhizophagus irregularis]|uniref:Uncharacterized protein n=1 Tax=Rhizophagus irregularis TaxID=588596 RepID=A0A2N1NEB3_9GLOM|nr:hypothetical protein RhiirC2_710541 [Rhizophagus irregularis]